MSRHIGIGREDVAERRVLAYEEEVAARVVELRATSSNPEAMVGVPFLEHEPGECIECDALRALSDG